MVKRAVINILAGQRADLDHAITGPNHKAYADRIGAEYRTIRRDSSPSYGPAIKYLANTLTPEYDQCLFIDCDAVVTAQAPNIFDEVPLGYWAIMDERGRSQEPLADGYGQKMADKISDALNIPRIPLIRMLNSGVMVMPPDSARWYGPPKRSVPSCWIFEQLFLAMMLQLDHAKIIELDWRWNLCWCHSHFHQNRSKAFILHAAGYHGDRTPELEGYLAFA